MRLHLDAMGMIPAGYPRTFYRVSDWKSGRRLADFSTPGEAERFAVEDSGRGNLDHKVSALHLSGN